MAFHVPFSHRPSGQHNRPVYYIGYENPRRARRPRNWWGINSLVLFFLTFGIMSPLSLLMALKGLSKRPRGSAVVGSLLSLAGTAILGLIVVTAVGHARQAKVRQMHRYQIMQNAPMVSETEDLLVFAAEEFEGFRDDHDGKLPEHHDGNMLSIKHIDAWGKELMYEVDTQYAGLRSAGPDTEFFTADDVALAIEGETQAAGEPLLPVGGPAEAEID